MFHTKPTQALGAIESCYRNIWDLTPDAVISVDERQRILFFNQGAEKTFGYQAEEVFGKPLDILIPKAFFGVHRKAMRDFCVSPEATRLTNERREIVARKKDGTEYLAEATISKFCTNRRFIFMVVLRDITERKRTEAELNAQNRNMEALYRISQILLHSTPLASTLEAILEEALKTGPYDTAVVGLVHPRTQRIEVVAYQGYRDPANTSANLTCLASGRINDPRTRFTELAQTWVADHLPASHRFSSFGSESVLSAIMAPIRTGSEFLGVLQVGCRTRVKFQRDNVRLLENIASHIAVAVQNNRLYEESRLGLERIRVLYETGKAENTRLLEQVKKQALQLRQSREHLRRLASDHQSVREEERAEIAREIHDELGQVLTRLKLDLVWLRKKLPRKQSCLSVKLKATSRVLDQTIHVVRKISTRLRPRLLDDLGLSAAMEWYLQEFRTRTAAQCKLYANLEEITLDRRQSTALFRIFQEALTNVTRHARASEIHVTFRQENDCVVLQVRDNGVGFEPTKVSDPKSIGLLGIQERAWLLGGEATITGSRGQGTAVTVRLPFTARPSEETRNEAACS